MKKLFIYASMLLTGAMAYAGQSVPYNSDFYVGFSLDEGWQNVNKVSRYGVSWEALRDLTPELLELGIKGGAVKVYSNSQSRTADAWLISPAIDVVAGEEYTVSIMAKTTASYGETESLRVNMASSSEVDALKSGKVLIERGSYENLGAYETLSATFTADATGEVYFGVQCYSEPDMDHLYVTRFSITGGSEEGGGDKPVVDIEGKKLPYSCKFDNSSEFNKDWKSVAGQDAENTSAQWTMGWGNYANWDFTNGLKEDNWLISPALSVENAGTYAIDLNIWANGKLEVLLGTDPDDLTSFSVVTTYEDNEMKNSDDPLDRFMTQIETPGTYYLAFRACSESGTYMGHRIYEAGFKQSVVTPAVATDFKALPDFFDELSVSLSWVYPSLTNTGERLKEITKAELYRGDELIQTYYYPTVGGSWAYEDASVPAAGVYTYKLLVYGENGYDTDSEPASATTGYVGRPTYDLPGTMPLEFNKDLAPLFTIEDANNDGVTWNPDYDSYYFSFYSDNKDNREMDDYIASPYIHLGKGYYRLSVKVGGSNNIYEIGYVTDRHHQAQTFVNCATIDDDQYSSPSEREVIVAIPEEGDYCFAIHHTGSLVDPTRTYYYTVKFNYLALEEQQLLPGIATELVVVPAADNSLSATVSWTNPALDNANMPLTAISRAVIYRDDEKIAEITTGLTPGESSSYVDNTVPKVGEYTYSVEIYNENGKAEEDGPVASTWVGEGITGTYTTSTFEDWKTTGDNEWYYWELDYDDIFGFSKSWGDPLNAYAISPYFELEAGSSYEIKIESVGGGNLTARLNNGANTDVTTHSNIGEITPHDSDDTTHIFLINAVSSSAPTPAAANEDEGAATNATVPAGKNVFSLHANEIGTIKLKSFSITKRDAQTGITDINDDKAREIEAYYTLDGIRIDSADTPARGLYIIRYTDGTTRKVYISGK
ncbi:MAG: choice-of-anchor J domain-containing protein [Muribaculaceae bacterium]|nr:choice-of-anchor J domain-containing protein [Muribaculaceae bacterium]